MDDRPGPLLCRAMLHVYAMCGVAFSGKSTLARRIANQLSIPLISLYAINHERGLRGREGMSIAQWEETSAMAMDRLRQCLPMTGSPCLVIVKSPIVCVISDR